MATLHGRSYYKIINALKSLGLKFDSAHPEEVRALDSQLVITTKEERHMVRHGRVLLDSELEDEPALIKARILQSLMVAYHNDELIIGIDPGRRIGVAAFYLQREIESRVLTPPEAVFDLVTKLISGITSPKKVIRIGDGDPAMAVFLASGILSRLKEHVAIEFVNEHGTSSVRAMDANRRGVRDRFSARAIALRRGRLYTPLRNFK